MSWIFYAIGSALFAGLTAILAKCGCTAGRGDFCLDSTTVIEFILVPL